MRVNIEYGTKRLEIEVKYGKRKHLAVTVHPDKKVIVKAPAGCGKNLVQALVKKRAAWIFRQIEYFDQFHPLQPERLYKSGETHYYLGRQYRLRIRAGQKKRVRLRGGFFDLELPEPGDTQKAKTLMENWYSSHAGTLLDRKVKQYLPYFLRLGAPEPTVKYRRMKRRWGSCSARGVITFNTEVVKAPVHCVDYVVIHELCHLLYLDHDQKFYRLLGRVLPDWEKRKKRLEKVVL